MGVVLDFSFALTVIVYLSIWHTKIQILLLLICSVWVNLTAKQNQLIALLPKVKDKPPLKKPPKNNYEK